MIAKGRNAILLERELCADASRIIGNLGCAFGMTFDQGLSFIEDGIGLNVCPLWKNCLVWI